MEQIVQKQQHDGSHAAPEKHEHGLASAREHVAEINNELTAVDTYEDDQHVPLGWRSWLVVFVTLYSNIVQVYIVVAIGTIIAFIIRDLGEPGLAGWAIQGPLLMQSVLSPIVGRLSDVFGRKTLVVGLPLIGFAGACLCAKSSSINALIGGSIMTGMTLSTLGIVLAIPSEVLPLKYRTISGGSAFLGGAIGGLVGGLSAGKLTNSGPSGWRDVYWLQAALHLSNSLLFLVAYFPPRKSDYERQRMSWSEYLWCLDPIGSILFIGGAALVILALDWAPDTYAYNNPHVAVSLAIGLLLLVLFGIYEWKGRADGLVSHAYFKHGPNFALATFAFGVEGWIFYSAVNSIAPQIALNLGWENNSWRISIRQLAYQCCTIFATWPVVWYSTRFKDLKTPLVASYILFLIVTICFATVKPSEGVAEYVFLVIQGFGQCAPLTLLTVLVQFTAPHAYLSTATGLAFAARSIGGAFGSAVLDAIINNYIAKHLAPEVGGVAVKAGLPKSSVGALLKAFASGEGFNAIPGLNSTILAAASGQKDWTYAHAYRIAWASIIPFIVLAVIAVACTSSVKHLMTEHVEATVEKVEYDSKERNTRNV